MTALQYPKWEKIKAHDIFKHSIIADLIFIDKWAGQILFSQQDLMHLLNIARDLRQWDVPPLAELPLIPLKGKGKDRKKHLISQIEEKWNQYKEEGPDYTNFKAKRDFSPEEVKVESKSRQRNPLGQCPVASPKTRCCNLFTLDAVERCGFDCTYCSIQSFYNEGIVTFDKDFSQRLKNLELDPRKRYHIGTGQSSDSLMWGNKEGVLDSLLEFARKNRNIILEFKTKSSRVDHLLKQKELPKNLLCTWSLNPEKVIDAEEHFTASLTQRLESARKVADRGVKVGFHFHPMIRFKGWQEEYSKLFTRLHSTFSSEEVVTISIGTLTFIKPVIKKLRSRELTTRILQMPTEESAGKYSYPLSIKRELFSFAYEQMKPWHQNVFFYLCMEDPALWAPCLKRSYESNEEFEKDMLDFYFQKMGIKG